LSNTAQGNQSDSVNKFHINILFLERTCPDYNHAALFLKEYLNPSLGPWTTEENTLWEFS
jgi:hypothetical protein